MFILETPKMKKRKQENPTLPKKAFAKNVSGWLPHAVGVSSRSELLDATVWTNVFNDVTKGDFVL